MRSYISSVGVLYESLKKESCFCGKATFTNVKVLGCCVGIRRLLKDEIRRFFKIASSSYVAGCAVVWAEGKAAIWMLAYAGDWVTRGAQPSWSQMFPAAVK